MPKTWKVQHGIECVAGFIDWPDIQVEYLVELFLAKVQGWLMLRHSSIGNEAIKAPSTTIDFLDREFDGFLLSSVDCNVFEVGISLV